jgi:sialidase-1
MNNRDSQKKPSRRLHALAMFGVFAFCFLAVCATGAPRSAGSRTVFTSGTEGYHTFRIPSIIRAANGDLLAFCEGRKNNGSDRGDIDIVLKRSTDGGLTWGALAVIWDDGENTCGNPCPVVDATTGGIQLLLTHNIGTDSEKAINAGTGKGSRTVWIMRSRDHGATWSAAEEITETTKAKDWRWYATGPGVGIQIKDGPHAGRLVAPCDHSYPDGSEAGYAYGSHAIYSDDHGKTWRLGAPIQPKVNECQVAELFDGKGTLLMDMRSYHKRSRRAQCLSGDGGATWSEITFAADLVEPVCQASILRWETGKGSDRNLLLFSNPANATKRVNLTIKASADNGRTWPRALIINEGPSAYSCLIDLGDDRAGCLYENGEKNPYARITFVTFSKADLIK